MCSTVTNSRTDLCVVKGLASCSSSCKNQLIHTLIERHCNLSLSYMAINVTTESIQLFLQRCLTLRHRGWGVYAFNLVGLFSLKLHPAQRWTIGGMSDA